jgi:hypothetical protein
MQPQSNPFGASRQDHQDYLERFRQGPQAVSEEEAASRYEQVAPNLPPEVYHQSAQEVFAQLSPEQRMQLGQALIQSARQHGQSFPDVNQDGIDDRLQDPDYLAQTATQVEQQQPGLLSRILGGGATKRPTGEETPADSAPTATPQVGAPQVGAGGMLGSPMAKGILGGIAGAGLMNMLTGPNYYSGGLFGAPVMGGFFGGGPMFGGYGFGEGYEEGYEEGLEEGFEGDFGGGDFGEGDFGGGDF